MVDFNLSSFKSTYREYARAYTFYANILNCPYFEENNRYLVTATRLPATTNDSTDVNWQGHRYRIATTQNYEDFTISWNIDTDSKLRTQFLEWATFLNNPVDNMHGDPEGGNPQYFAQIYLTHLNPRGEEIQEFKLDDCWPTSVGEVTLDYSSKEVAKFDVTFAYQFHTIKGINH